MNVELLHRLRAAAGGFVPVGGPSDPEGIAADLSELEAFGFALERHPYLGVAYRGPADRLCPDQIEYRLGARRIGRRIAVWDRVASTNDLAARAAASLSNEGLVVLAEEQSAGRGRRGRVWSSPPRRSVLMSVLLFPKPELSEPAWLTALAAVAVAEVVSEWTGHAAAIKWPNDVRVGGRKVAGILVERSAGSVVGIGLNANVRPLDWPEDLRERSTSLEILVGSPVDRSELVRDLIRRLDSRYDDSYASGPDALSVPWRDRSEHINARVEITTPAGRLRGTMTDMRLSNGLRLETEEGRSLLVPVGHIISISNV